MDSVVAQAARTRYRMGGNSSDAYRIPFTIWRWVHTPELHSDNLEV